MAVAVKVSIRRYVDDSQPGWVECVLVDAQDREWLIIEKVPIVTSENLSPTSSYPQPGIIACQILERHPESVTIDIAVPWQVESVSGQTQFDVFPNQLTTF